MKKLILLLLVTSIAISCTEEDDYNILLEGTGKWRLESVLKPMVNETIQYDHVNIVLSFDKKTLTVSGNDGSFFIEDGTYQYVFVENDEFPTHTIKIDDRLEYACYFEDNKMIFSWAHLDGEVFTFHRLYFL